MDKDTAGSRWNSSIIGERLRKEYVPLLPIYKDLKVVLVCVPGRMMSFICFLFLIEGLSSQDKHNITLSQAGLRWLQYHSLLGPTDAVIIGASTNAQLESNLKDA